MRDGASFTELSVDRLSTEAGISRASFYIYFEDKGHLLRCLAVQVFADLAASAERWWGVAWRHDVDDVRAAMAGIIASYRRHQPVLGRPQRDGRAMSRRRRDLPRSADGHLGTNDRRDRGRPGRRFDPSRAARGDDRERAGLDGRAGLPAEPARASHPTTMPSWPPRWPKSFGAHCISRPPTR